MQGEEGTTKSDGECLPAVEIVQRSVRRTLGVCIECKERHRLPDALTTAVYRRACWDQVLAAVRDSLLLIARTSKFYEFLKVEIEFESRLQYHAAQCGGRKVGPATNLRLLDGYGVALTP